jgi:hypothetical protein
MSRNKCFVFSVLSITCFTFYIHLWPIYWLSLLYTPLHGNLHTRRRERVWKFYALRYGLSSYSPISLLTAAIRSDKFWTVTIKVIVGAALSEQTGLPLFHFNCYKFVTRTVERVTKREKRVMKRETNLTATLSFSKSMESCFMFSLHSGVHLSDVIKTTNVCPVITSA